MIEQRQYAKNMRQERLRKAARAVLHDKGRSKAECVKRGSAMTMRAE